MHQNYHRPLSLGNDRRKVAEMKEYAEMITPIFWSNETARIFTKWWQQRTVFIRTNNWCSTEIKKQKAESSKRLQKQDKCIFDEAFLILYLFSIYDCKRLCVVIGDRTLNHPKHFYKLLWFNRELREKASSFETTKLFISHAGVDSFLVLDNVELIQHS